MIKTPEQIEKMRFAGKLASEVLEMITPLVKPGISTGELDKICHDFIVNEQDAIPANVGYKGYEKTICSSLNQVVCHGIPDFQRKLKDGDILNIDVTVKKDGWHGDTSKMFLVGKSQPHNERLVNITQECLYKGIEQVKPGAHLGDIGNAIQSHAEKNHSAHVPASIGLLFSTRCFYSTHHDFHPFRPPVNSSSSFRLCKICFRMYSLPPPLPPPRHQMQPPLLSCAPPWGEMSKDTVWPALQKKTFTSTGGIIFGNTGSVTVITSPSSSNSDSGFSRFVRVASRSIGGACMKRLSPGFPSDGFSSCSCLSPFSCSIWWYMILNRRRISAISSFDSIKFLE